MGANSILQEFSFARRGPQSTLEATGLWSGGGASSTLLAIQAERNGLLAYYLGQRHVKGAPSTRLALCPDLAAVLFDDLFDLGQTN